ncbi:nucleoside hydrolase [Rhizobium sp. YK2]|uniref:nucleoside hydrolase n=1 Tax=Rhizobium sp. YK2 TaxID=1860096 RepID=UPI0009F6F8B3|nr:nucleoside hydrolase [Rhizobium sp. YK2]
MKKVLIDSDTGLDDAMAFVHGMLMPEIEIIGVTAGHGNGATEDCAYHAIELIELMGKNIPVVRGAQGPLISGCGFAPEVHGPYARGALGKLDYASKVTPGYGPVFMLEQIRRYGADLTIVAMGRLTNLALAYCLDPELMKTVGSIMWLGGAHSTSGNTSPTGEANLDGDPEAARIVLRPELPVTIVTLDVSMDARITDADVQAMKAVEHPGVQHLTKILPFYLDFYEKILGVRECSGHVGLLLAMVAHPSLIRKIYRLPVRVETAGEFTRGMLVVDRRTLRSVTAPSGTEQGLRIVWEADTAKYRQLFLDAILAAAA